LLQKFVSGLSEKERKIFYITAIIVGLALMDRLFLNPVLGHLASLDKKIADEKSAILRDRKILSFQEKIEKASTVFNKYFSQSVPDDDVVNADFLRLIERLASQSNVSLVKSNPSHTDKGEQVNEYFASVDANGKLQDVMSFMHTVNTTEELLKVTEFNMTPQRGQDNTVKVSMTIVKVIVH
jgi:hypothetical protein